MKYTISQCSNYDCGFTCVKILLANIHNDSNYLYLPEQKGSAYSFYDLKELANTYHLNLVGYKVSDDVLELKQLKTPFIASICNETSNHSILIYKVTKRRIYFIDPNYGKDKMSINDLFSKWDNNILEIYNYEKNRCPYKKIKSLSNTNKVTLSLIQLLAGLSFITAIFFMDKEVIIAIPISFFIMYGLIEIIKKCYLISIMKRMDDRYINAYEPTISKDYWNYYLAYNEMKKYSLTFSSRIIISTLSVAFLIAVTLINGLYNLFYIITPIIISLIQTFISEPLLKKLNRECLIVEETIKNSNSGDYKKKVSLANQIAYKMTNISDITNYISTALILISIILIMIVTNNVSLTVGVFYLFIGIFIKENLISIFKSISNRDLYNRSVASVTNFLNRK